VRPNLFVSLPRGLRTILLSNLLFLAWGCATGEPSDSMPGDPVVVREYPTGSNILRRDRGVPSEVKVYDKSLAEEWLTKPDQQVVPKK
jgi:hypothetical protein